MNRPVDFFDRTFELGYPDPTSDETELYGTLLPDWQLARTRELNPGYPIFSRAVPVLVKPPAGVKDFSPSISGDCRTLYFLRKGDIPNNPIASTIYVVRRERCGDHADNDGDGYLDCDDCDCAEPRCSGSTCHNADCGGVIPCVEICGDTFDNDYDGDADCADSDCACATGGESRR